MTVSVHKYNVIVSRHKIDIFSFENLKPIVMRGCFIIQK